MRSSLQHPCQAGRSCCGSLIPGGWCSPVLAVGAPASGGGCLAIPVPQRPQSASEGSAPLSTPSSPLALVRHRGAVVWQQQPCCWEHT